MNPTAPITTTTEPANPSVDPTRQARTGVLRCFACGDPGHRQSTYPNRNRRGLLIDSTGRDIEVEYEDVSDDTPEELEADSGVSLML